MSMEDTTTIPNPEGGADSRLTALETLAQANLRAMQEVKGLRDDIAKVDASRGRDLNLFKWAMALVLFLVCIAVFMVLTNRPILDLIKSTVTPEGEIYKANTERTTLLLQNLVVEQDCRNRRAMANLSAPPTTIVIRDGKAVTLAKAPCGDLPDSPPGFQSPPKLDPPPLPPPSKSGNRLAYAVMVAVGLAVIAGVVYQKRTREETHP